MDHVPPVGVAEAKRRYAAPPKKKKMCAVLQKETELPKLITLPVPDMSGIVKPLPVIQDTPLTKTDQHLQGQHIYNDNISPTQYHELASEKDMPTSGLGAKSNLLTRFLARSKYRLWILIASIILVLLAIILGVLGGLGKLSPHNSSDLAVSGTSIGATKYPGTSNGTATPGHFDMYGSGDGTYYGIDTCS